MGRNQAMDVARVPENRGKNRYNNILPCRSSGSGPEPPHGSSSISCFLFQMIPPESSCPTWRTTPAPTTSTPATYLCVHTLSHTHRRAHTGAVTFCYVCAGEQLPQGVHRCAGPAARHQGRLLEDGVGAWGLQRCHGNAVCGERTGEPLDLGVGACERRRLLTGVCGCVCGAAGEV